MSSKPPNSFFNESAAIVEVLLDGSGIYQSPLWRKYDAYLQIYIIYVRIWHDLLPEFVGRVFQG